MLIESQIVLKKLRTLPIYTFYTFSRLLYIYTSFLKGFYEDQLGEGESQA